MLNLFKKKEPVIKPFTNYIPPEQPEYEDYLELLIDINKSAYILGKQSKDEYLTMKSALGDILDKAEARRCTEEDLIESSYSIPATMFVEIPQEKQLI